MIIHDCEQGTDEWHQLRAGIPTASEFSKLVTSQCKESKSIDDYAIVLAAEKYAGKMVDGFSGNKYTERGHELEQEAIDYYSMVKGVAVDKVGFITNDLKTYGCSPDGLVSENGSIEIKCKIAKEHIKALMRWDKNQTIPPEYFAQPQGVMFVSERDYCDLVFYHPDLPSLIVRQTPNDKFINTLKKQLKLVIAKRNVIFNQLKKVAQ